MDPLIAVVGATGTGKSKLAVDLAARFNGEIINGDAMQMYRGLPIITNQIPIAERKGIPHHLLSCVDLEAEAWRISHFKRKHCVLSPRSGVEENYPSSEGSGSDVEDGVDADGAGYEEIPSTSEKWPILDSPPEVLMEKLKEVDPVMAARWHPKDARKIRRSLEIYFQTGRPASEIYAEQQAQKEKAVSECEGLLRFDHTLIFWVHAEKDVLNARLDARVDDMVQQGLLDEAESMFEFLQRKEEQGVSVDLTRGVWVSIGFKELAPYFTARRKAEMSEEELDALRSRCIEAIRTATRQYGGSQVKWIRNKLWRALAEAGMTRRLYLLDSSDVSQWDGCITEPSEQIFQSMLQGDTTPDPKSLSMLAKTVLGAKEEQAQAQPGSAMKSFTCDVCGKTVVGDEQWENHLKSYSHKRGVKSAARKAERDAYFRMKELEAQKGERETEVDSEDKLNPSP
ncbi:uncharacterized protein N7458_006059 [Penicillium daleae]|uniref:tRNA dimethylallyltransferase n=1 Tax=Penicillium daleae TaxID=63821 RepID=A0AAD6C411_9EURO|nr:uncharacterized protein N7458_006059 [Penicillium daleae]KAJ5449610.1 hypothetical protein N7458_006059 [Penicillium daleae]